MEIFVWRVEPVVCLEHQRRYPKKNSQVAVKMPLFFPEASENSLCLCQNVNCPIIKIGACNRRATFIEVFPEKDPLAGTITPQLRSVSKPQLALSGI
jgi:hypothetical protein